MQNIEINEQFKKALDLLEKTNKNVFITGRAGTGKSTLLDYFRNKTGKKVVVLAPTGVAAVNVKGQTIHSFFGFKPDITLSKVKKTSSAKKRKLYMSIDTIIIDEISMVRADLLDCVDKYLRLNCGKNKLPFGGRQMVFIGDLYQLPPVIKSKEREYFKSRYATGYFFSSDAFRDIKMDLIELLKIYRQKDETFIEILNAIRNNTVTPELLDILNERYDSGFRPGKDDFYVYLTPYNRNARDINEVHLKEIRGRPVSFEGDVQGDFSEKEMPTEKTLLLKTGAQVMLLNNDPSGRWVNGTIGKITGMEYNEKDDIYTILTELNGGDIVGVIPYKWEIFEYRYDRNSRSLEFETIGSFTQYPLRLAWAITIHKSQGKTFNKVIIDLGRGTFSPGQMYVGLSRCASLEGLVLKQRIQKKHIFYDWKVANFMTGYQYRISEEKIPVEDKVGAIERSIKNGSMLEIVYLKSSDVKSFRIIEPQSVGMMEYKDRPFLGVEAFCLKRKKMRNFRVDRILEMKEVKKLKRLH